MKKKNKLNKQRKLAQKRARQYLQTLDAGKIKISLEIKNYQQLGFIIQSILNVCQSSLFTKEINAEHHENLDIFNLLNLAYNLMPVEEFELLDEISKKDLK